MKRIYDLLFEGLTSNYSDYSNPETSLVSLDNPNNILEDNTAYYVFAGGTKPFHAGHDMLLSKIIRDAKQSNGRAVACFFIGLGSRKRSDNQIEITGDQVQKIWKEVVEPRLRKLAGSDLEVYVEYGGGPVIKARQIIQAMNTGAISGSKVFLYGDPEDSRGNYLTPTYYKRDESTKSIERKRLEDPDYAGYLAGEYSRSSPHFDLENLRVAAAPGDDGDDFDVVFPGLVNPDTTGERITSGTELRIAAACGDFDGFLAGLPDFVKNDPELIKVYIVTFLKECGNLNEIKRAEKGTQQYTSYLEEIMDELQHIKASYDFRKKKGARYRKEASKIQDAYSELRRLRNKNNKILDAQKINETVNYERYSQNVSVTEEFDFKRDDIKDFLKKIK